MSDGFTPFRDPTNHTDANKLRFDLDTLADKAERRLREHLNEHMNRKPTEEEVKWVRNFPRRMASGRQPEDPRIPTITEVQNHFSWGPSETEKKRLGEDFVEQHRGANLTYR